MTMIFAAFINLCMQAFGNVTPVVYWQKLIILLLGASMVSLGVALQGIADVLKLAGEGLVYTISDTYHLDFGKVKIANDGILVTLPSICPLYGDRGHRGRRPRHADFVLLPGLLRPLLPPPPGCRGRGDVC